MAFCDKDRIVDSIYVDEQDCTLILESLYSQIIQYDEGDQGLTFDRLIKLYCTTLTAKESIINERNKPTKKI